MRFTAEENPCILAKFTTGSSATVTVYNLSNDAVVVNSVAMSEVASTGIFKYFLNQNPASKTDYLWVAESGGSEHQGYIVLGGHPDLIRDHARAANSQTQQV